MRVRGGELIGVPQRLPQGLEVIAQRLAVEELHGVPGHAVLHAFADEPHDAGMAHAEERQDLAAQRADGARPRTDDGLERDHLPGLDVTRAIDDAHAASRDRLDDAIWADGLGIHGRNRVARPIR